MSLLKPAINQTAFLKLGILGFEGAGKSHTACNIAIGLTKLTKGKKVAFFDTETGSDYHIHRFKEAGIQLDVAKTRAFKDLLQVIRDAEKDKYSFLIIDSITHVWRDLCASYLKKRNRNFMTIKDWGILKQEWSQFSDLYVNSALHIGMLGRAGYEFETTEDEDGKKEMNKVGTKMRVETETGYEPSLLLEMYKVRKNKVTGNEKDMGFVNRCIVLKDRTDLMNGKVIDYPTFESFRPIINFLNLGGEHIGVDTSRNSEDMFDNINHSVYEQNKQREILLENLSSLLIKLGLDGTSQETKRNRVEFLEATFGTSSKTEIEMMSLGKLTELIGKIKEQANKTHE